MKKEYNKIIKAAEAGGEAAKKYFGKSLEIIGKSMPADFKTKADLESEKSILKILSREFPKFNIISEEAGEINKNSEYTFIIDPLDGTNNFVLGIPYFSISIGLMKGEESIFGAIYNPILKNMYFAEKRKGAFQNGKRIFVNKEQDIKNSSISLVVSYSDQDEYEGDINTGLYRKKAKRVLLNWSVVLDFCLLALGKIEGIIVHSIPLHDFVAGKLIAKEAGALVTDFSGNKEKNDKNNIFLASNGTKIHGEILEVLKSIN